MAEQGESTDEAKAPSGKKKLIIIIAAVVFVLLLAGGAYFFFFSGDPESEPAQDTKEATTKVESIDANYVPMPRPLVFNVLEGTRDRTAQIKVQLMVLDKSNVAIVRKHIPLLESTLVRVFGEASAEALRSPQGKNELRKVALEELNKATMMVEKKALIHTVLFTGFVLQ